MGFSMVIESISEKLGFKKDDKLVIIHIDDMGFSHSSNIGSFKCLDFGVATCGSVIIPSAWFLETASICRSNPHYDVGVHLTLTCEYETYRWRALSSVDPKTGLLDHEMCLWRTTEEALANVTPEAAEKEMRAQIQTALDQGIDVTHIDTHMGTVIYPKFIQSYIQLAQEFDIPAFIPKLTREEMIAMGFGEYADLFLSFLPVLEESGLPLLDQIIIDTGGEQKNKTDYYCKRFAEIKSGLTHLLFHPAQMSSELEAITKDSAVWRNQDFEAFTNPIIKKCVDKFQLKLIGYRQLRDLMRKNH